MKLTSQSSGRITKNLKENVGIEKYWERKEIKREVKEPLIGENKMRKCGKKRNTRL